MARRALSRKAPTGTAMAAGVRLLARRAHSRAELRQKLVRRGYNADAVESALGRMAELGYLDDAAFARSLVRRRSTSRGPLALSAELSAKGIDRAGAADALGEFPVEAQVEVATRLAVRLYAGSSIPGYREMMDRVGSKLLRRGFSVPVVRAACRAAFAVTPSSTEA